MSWLCIFSVSDADVGTSCNETVECEATIESCNAAASSCICSSGYFDVSGQCKLSKFPYSITIEKIIWNKKNSQHKELEMAHLLSGL